ncbi:hypothetical protein PFISCL1PPCAC_4569, partial [Pristionchus fissidentatus]
SIDEVEESDLPVYLRGIGWNNVEAERSKDLRLSNFIRPIHYEIKMNVSIKGYENSHSSRFDGKILISLNISAPTKVIELHSLGLDIQNVDVYAADITGKRECLTRNEFKMDRERETIVIPSRRYMQPREDVHVEIKYNGTALMDGEGFYESWSTRENSNSSSPSLPLFISLVTHCEPAGARRWFPCFDEPDKKARFSLTIEHPQETNAFSNTHILKKSTLNGRRLTQFEQTVPLPTYVVALSVTEQPVMQLNMDGYQFRGIGLGREMAVQTAARAYKIIRNNSVFDGIPFFPKKTDILIVEDFSHGAMENPGLITIKKGCETSIELHTHELAHMYFGNLVTLRSWNDIWVNEGFADFYEGNGDSNSSDGNIFLRSFDYVSLHDRAIHSEISSTSYIHLYNYFASHTDIHYTKASEMLSMIRKYVGAIVFDRAIKGYLRENAYGNGDAVDVISHLIREFDGDKNLLHTMLHEWIYQPGKAILFVSREKYEVRIKQMRFTSTFFDEQLRDTETRWTIPLFCKIDGKDQTIVLPSSNESTTISVPSKSSFSITEEFPQLFVVHWVTPNQVFNEDSNYVSLLSRLSKLQEFGLISMQNFVHYLSPKLNNSHWRSVMISF